MTAIAFTNGEFSLPVANVENLVTDACDRLRISRDQLAAVSGADLISLASAKGSVRFDVYWPLVRYAYEERRLIDLLPAHGVPAFNYDLVEKVDLERGPLGFIGNFSPLTLEIRKTEIAGHMIDFPIGVPASILTTNASFLRYYAQRGYCVLTYKTVRSREHRGNSYPQWFCLENPGEFNIDAQGRQLNKPSFRGRLRRFPESRVRASMANSFGVPSLSPGAWKEDLREARSFIERGRQLLIVSVMSSVNADMDTIKADFAETAKMARDCGADVVELNFSCPNTREKEGLIYTAPVDAHDIALHVQEALDWSVPVFTKIGHLSDQELREYVEHTWKVVDGIVGINTMTAPVINAEYPDDRPAFEKGGGVSGWAVQNAAHHAAQTLVALRDEIERRHGKRLVILGVGGVMSRSDFDRRLGVGVDAVEICTGTYFNPMLGFECRNAQGTVELSAAAVRVGRGQSAATLSGAKSLSSPGANSRTRARSAEVPATREKQERASGCIDPVEANTALTEYYEKTPQSKVVRDRKKWMAELVEQFDRSGK